MGKCAGERIKLLFVRNGGSEEKKGEDIRRQNNRERKLELFLIVRLDFRVRRMYVFHLGIRLPSSQPTSLEWCQPFGFCMKFPLLTKNNEPTIQLQHPGQHDPADKNLQPADGVS